MGDRLLIVGAGASGLMAAIQAARAGASVTILESNDKPGKKLLASGNGKCNLTNLQMPSDCLRSNNLPLAEKIMQIFPNHKTLDFFHDLGLDTIDKNGWVYPVTDQSTSVLRLLLLEAEHLKIKIKTRENVRKIEKKGNTFVVQTDGWAYEADAVIVACGSPASSVQGSSDAAMTFANDFGIGNHPFMPALVGLRLKGNFSQWAGVRFRGSVKLLINGQEMAADTGILQTVDFGISGIPVFQVSRYAVRAAREKLKTELLIDFIPSYSMEDLYDRLTKGSKRSPYKTMRQLLSGMLPEKLIPFLLPKDQKVSEQTITKMLGLLKEYKVTVKDSAGLKFAQVCSGGIALDQLTENLESGKVKNLYFAGEALDVDGMCGGYNLQWAWASGYVAGRAAAGVK